MCDAALPRRRRGFCSDECAGIWRKSPSVPITCAACGQAALATPKHAAERKYCSISCSLTTRVGPKNPRWRGGPQIAYGAGWKATKALVRARDGVCQHCGKTPEENGQALDVHHVVPFRFSGSNEASNLIALCRSCHMRTDDHGRRGSASFIGEHAKRSRPTKRELRRLNQMMRGAATRARRLEAQRDAVRLHEAGFSLREISRRVGSSHETIRGWVSRR